MTDLQEYLDKIVTSNKSRNLSTVSIVDSKSKSVALSKNRAQLKYLKESEDRLNLEPSKTICTLNKSGDPLIESKFETTSETAELCGAIIRWSLDIADGNNNAELVLGDSDDESDGECYDHDHESSLTSERLTHEPVMRIERLLSSLRSSSIKERERTIEALQASIEVLHSELQETIKPLSLPSPYQAIDISFTHRQYGALVSDLAPGSNHAGSSIPVCKVIDTGISSQFGMTSVQQEYVEDKGPLKRSRHSQILKQMQAILDTCGSHICRLFNDANESCRYRATQCACLLCVSGLDIGNHVAYLMPAIVSKYPPAMHDDEMRLFVNNVEGHEFFKRGGAIERQDRSMLLTRGSKIYGTESCEEIRLSICHLISCILRCVVHRDTVAILDCYYSDLIFVLQYQLHDPFPELKIAAARLLVQIIRMTQWQAGAKYFSTALARSVIPNLRHRNSKVRCASIELFEANVGVPNKEKVKGAGTEAIVDLVGFREENVRITGLESLKRSL